MKILHIMTTDRGGAGVAAKSLHQGLLSLGHDSKMLCMLKNGNEKFIYKYSIPFFSRFARFLKKKGLLSNELYNMKKEFSKIDSNVEIFSYPYSYIDVKSTTLFKEADIINLHWVSGFINYPSFFEGIDKPIVWTLHDMNPFMGGFHYQEDCDRNEELKELDTKIRRIKKQEIQKVKNLTIVTPSIWLKSCSEKSDLLGGFEHLCIPYGLDFNIYKPYNKSLVRRKYNIPEDQPLLLFVSENIYNRRKGFDLLLDALELLPNKNISIGLIGSCDTDIKLYNTYYFGKISDNNILAELYSAADAFVLPSREDNLPNTMVEAISCGTPVICFPVGGMLDVIKVGFNGILANDVSSIALASAIEEFLLRKEKFDSNEIRNFALSNFSLNKQALLYEKLYKRIL